MNFKLGLNEHAPYKREVARPKWRLQKLFDMHKTWPSGHLSEQHRKSSQNDTYSSSFWHKPVATQSLVYTIARASTRDSCFRRAIADTKKSVKYCLLLAKETYQGNQTPAFSCQKGKNLFSIVCVEPRCL